MIQWSESRNVETLLELEILFPEVQLITVMAEMYKPPTDDLFTREINLQQQRINPSPSARSAF